MPTAKDTNLADDLLDWAMGIDEIAERAESAADGRVADIISRLREVEMLCNELHGELK